MKKKSCVVCGKPAKILKSATLRGRYYCSFTCYTKGSRYFFLFFWIIFSIGSLLLLLAIMYNFIKGYPLLPTDYASIVFIVFGFEILFSFMTGYGFKTKIQKYSEKNAYSLVQ